MTTLIRGIPLLVQQIKEAETKLVELRNIIDSIVGLNADGKVQKIAKINAPSVRDIDVSLLTNQELKVFKLVGQNKKTDAISKELGTSYRTIEAQRYSIRKKLGIKKLSEFKIIARNFSGGFGE